MESLLENLKFAKETKFEIIGNEHQSLQLVLFPGDSIITHTNSLLYMSTNIKKKSRTLSIKDTVMYYQQSNCNKSYRNFISPTPGEEEYANESETVGYLGISRRIGKVIVINPGLSTDICFKPETLLAYTSGMAFDKKQKSLELGLRTWDKFKPSLPLRGRAAQIFLQSSHGLIEKELGQNEEIIINRGSVFAFSSKIKFSYLVGQHKQYMSPLVKAKGPGLLYIENRHDSPSPVQNYKKGLILLLVCWLYILFPLLLWPF